MSLFSKEDIQLTTIAKGNKRLTCNSCKLYKGDISTPKMKPSGKFKKKILIIGEYTSVAQDYNNMIWRGRSGEMFKSVLFENNIDIDDCIYVNAVRCLPLNKKGKSQLPTNHQIDCCRVHLMKTINELKPKLIFLLGDIAVQSVIGHRWKKDLGNINKWRGWVIPDQDLKCWIAPIFAPSHVTNVNRPEVTFYWKKDVLNALQKLSEPVYIDKKPKIIDITGNLEKLNTIKNYDVIAFDFETTGLKPHAKGHKIVCCSVAVSPNKVYVFNIPKKKKKLKPFLNLMINKLIKKMAQNMKYEHAWTLEIFGERIKNWFWDSAIAAHILDNRKGIAGLKFQTYVQFGVIDYSSEITPILQSVDSKNANSLNRIVEYIKKPKNNKKMKTYCALDSIYQFRLTNKQKEEFGFYIQKEEFESMLPF